jgi:hypothetical protein
MPVTKEEVEAMIKDANATADKSLGKKKSLGKRIEWAVEERLYQLLGDEPYERIRDWLCGVPLSNGLAILLALIIIIID